MQLSLTKTAHAIPSRNHDHSHLHLPLIRSDPINRHSTLAFIFLTTLSLILHAKLHQMPQVDLETLLCGGDIKVSCETMISPEVPPPKRPEYDPDMPADSIQIPIGEQIDWTDINAVYERDDSTKGNTNPKSHHPNQKPLSTSQRFSGNLKPKAPIIALPNKIRNASYLGASARRNIKSSTLRKKRKTGGDRKSAIQALEPGSPKVSWFGKVLSERERGKKQQGLAVSVSSSADERVLSSRRSGGCFARLMGIFRCGGMKGVVEEEEDEEVVSTSPEKVVTWSGRSSAAAAPEGLGACRRFSSGRRSASWGGEEDMEGQMHVARSAPLDQEGATGRRSVG